MFTSAISKIWLVGLVIFALTPILIAKRPQPTETPATIDTPSLESSLQQPPSASGKIADKRDPASQAPLATGN